MFVILSQRRRPPKAAAKPIHKEGSGGVVSFQTGKQPLLAPALTKKASEKQPNKKPLTSGCGFNIKYFSSNIKFGL